jgi:uncharacterized damage-inducible protein DinB
MMTPAEREFVLRRFAETRERLLQTVHGLSREQLLYRPKPGRWSVAENVEHLAAVEQHIVGAIKETLQAPADLAKGSAMEDAEILRMVGTVVRAVQAPPRALPRSRWPCEQLAQEFESIRDRTREFTATTDGDLRRHFIAHFIFGELDCYQWLLLLGAHCDRHCAQSNAVKACAGFPR